MRRLVYVSGKLGAGKTSLAFPLAAELGYSLVTKDLVKETLHDALHVPGEGEIDRAWSRRLGGASMELLWALAARAGDMVIEANFHPHNEYELDKLRGLGGSVVEVHCACPAEVAVARYNARSRHEVHVLKEVTLTEMERYDRPVGIGSLITVDTTAPVDVAAVAAEVRRLHGRIGPWRRTGDLPNGGAQLSPASRQLALTAARYGSRSHLTGTSPHQPRSLAQAVPTSAQSHKSIGHAEVRIGDSAVMMFDARDDWPRAPAFLRLYVPDATTAYQRALAADTTPVTEVTALFSATGPAGSRTRWATSSGSRA